ncbi:MAG TPA: MarR family transcriptional regulator, partial [Verrucomicrobiota bacterium]|nr:MarR family transcriptional regulator [Verrucomicrobiota bacterium]
MTAAETARYAALLQLLRTAEDLWNASRVFFARWDLSPSQFNVLNLLREQPDGLSQAEFSRLLVMHRSNATGLVDRLELRGLVRRTNDPADRRAYRVLLTPAGRRLVESILPEYHDAAERVWEGVSPGHAEHLLDDLRRLATNAAAITGAPVTTGAAPPAAPPAPAKAQTARPRP